MLKPLLLCRSKSFSNGSNYKIYINNYCFVTLTSSHDCCFVKEKLQVHVTGYDACQQEQLFGTKRKVINYSTCVSKLNGRAHLKTAN